MISVHAVSWIYELRTARRRLAQHIASRPLEQAAGELRELEWVHAMLNTMIGRLEDGRTTLAGSQADAATEADLGAD